MKKSSQGWYATKHWQIQRPYDMTVSKCKICRPFNKINFHYASYGYFSSSSWWVGKSAYFWSPANLHLNTFSDTHLDQQMCLTESKLLNKMDTLYYVHCLHTKCTFKTISFNAWCNSGNKIGDIILIFSLWIQCKVILFATMQKLKFLKEWQHIWQKCPQCMESLVITLVPWDYVGSIFQKQ
jgi:hypothetical protein